MSAEDQRMEVLVVDLGDQLHVLSVEQLRQCSTLQNYELLPRSGVRIRVAGDLHQRERVREYTENCLVAVQRQVLSSRFQHTYIPCFVL